MIGQDTTAPILEMVAESILAGKPRLTSECQLKKMPSGLMKLLTRAMRETGAGESARGLLFARSGPIIRTSANAVRGKTPGITSRWFRKLYINGWLFRKAPRSSREYCLEAR
jgi:hypothetical protein